MKIDDENVDLFLTAEAIFRDYQDEDEISPPLMPLA